MPNYSIMNLSLYPNLFISAARWFHDKWGVDIEAYLNCMELSVKHEASVPQWYLAMDGNKIIGGLGVIDNDFHNRKDLTPNICALYVEEDYRCNGIAGALVDYVCLDMHKRGIDTLYLITELTSFYERYGWKFFCMAQEDNGTGLLRLYIHRF